ncbi:MAG: hypothetical protein VXZ82_24040 [Planctomycetota bacterium]|nr:hypothetical protein [Planctomycetota bacterium]
MSRSYELSPNPMRERGYHSSLTPRDVIDRKSPAEQLFMQVHRTVCCGENARHEPLTEN